MKKYILIGLAGLLLNSHLKAENFKDKFQRTYFERITYNNLYNREKKQHLGILLKSFFDSGEERVVELTKDYNVFSYILLGKKGIEDSILTKFSYEVLNINSKKFKGFIRSMKSFVDNKKRLENQLNLPFHLSKDKISLNLNRKTTLSYGLDGLLLNYSKFSLNNNRISYSNHNFRAEYHFNKNYNISYIKVINF